MIRVVFTAKRALSGHSVGDSVTLTFSAASITPSRKFTRDVQTTLSGKRETLLHNALRSWSITTGPLATSTLDAVEEFLTAVEDGSAFDFEPFYVSGSGAATNSAETRLRATPTVRAVLGSESYDIAQVIGLGTGGASDWYQVTFSVDEVPA